MDDNDQENYYQTDRDYLGFVEQKFYIGRVKVMVMCKEKADDSTTDA